MIVTLNASQLHGVLGLVHDRRALHDELCSDPWTHPKVHGRWGTITDTDAAYIAWVKTRDALIERVFNQRGNFRQGVPYRLRSAMQVISQAINAYDAHPALAQRGMIGTSYEWVPAWRLDSHWSPAPTGHEFKVLMPRVGATQGMKITTWDWDGPPPSHRLAQEHVHLALVGA